MQSKATSQRTEGTGQRQDFFLGSGHWIRAVCPLLHSWGSSVQASMKEKAASSPVAVEFRANQIGFGGGWVIFPLQRLHIKRF